MKDSAPLVASIVNSELSLLPLPAASVNFVLSGRVELSVTTDFVFSLIATVDSFVNANVLAVIVDGPPKFSSSSMSGAPRLIDATVSSILSPTESVPLCPTDASVVNNPVLEFSCIETSRLIATSELRSTPSASTMVMMSSASGNNPVTPDCVANTQCPGWNPAANNSAAERFEKVRL